MFRTLFDFFYNSIWFTSGNTLNSIFGSNVALFGNTISLRDYLSFLCSSISIIFILVLCCLFIYRLIRLVGRLFSGGAL